LTGFNLNNGSSPNGFQQKLRCKFEKLVDLLISIERLVRLHLFAVLREECDSRVHKFGDGHVGEQMFHVMMLKISKRAKNKQVSQQINFSWLSMQHAISCGCTMSTFKTKIRYLYQFVVHNVFCVICRHRLLGVGQMLQRGC